MFEDGRRGVSTLQDAPVRKPLLAVSDVCDKGNAVLFSNEGSFVVPLAGPAVQQAIRLIKTVKTKIKAYREKGVNRIPAWVVPTAGDQASAPKAASGFTRQGA